MMADMQAMQEVIDRFYWTNGPCCAGCDYWEAISPLVGNCLKTPPDRTAEERAAALGFWGFSVVIGSGHQVTRRDHRTDARTCPPTGPSDLADWRGVAAML